MPARTRRQQEVLDIIDRHIATNGYRPSYQRIATILRLSSRAGIARIVQDLEEQGLLSRSRENGHFSIELNGSSNGVAIPWIENAESEREDQPRWTKEPLILANFMVGDYDPSSLRAYRMTDSAMSPIIEENDIAIIETRDFCRDRQLVVAELSNGDVVLREYYRHTNEIELRAESLSVESIVLPSTRVKILGVQRGLIRPAQ